MISTVRQLEEAVKMSSLRLQSTLSSLSRVPLTVVGSGSGSQFSSVHASLLVSEVMISATDQ